MFSSSHYRKWRRDGPDPNHRRGSCVNSKGRWWESATDNGASDTIRSRGRDGTIMTGLGSFKVLGLAGMTGEMKGLLFGIDDVYEFGLERSTTHEETVHIRLAR